MSTIHFMQAAAVTFLTAEAGSPLMTVFNLILYGVIIYVCTLVGTAIRKYNIATDLKAGVLEFRGSLLREHRTRRKMTQDAVAAKLKVSPQDIENWENDAAVPSAEKLTALTKLYRVKPEELLHRVQE